MVTSRELSRPRYLQRLAPFLGFGLVLGFVFYPIFIYPYFHKKEYKQIQSVNRKGIDATKTQPGDMKIWSDPFKRK